MPGLNPGEMNGHSDYGRFGPERGFTNGHFDPYSRDPYREDMRGDEDPYRRPVRNGGGRPTTDRFSNDHLADQSSLSDFNSSEPAFELDHLATFAAGGARKGTMHVEDGLRKLRQMENTTGIWTMRCILLVERRFIVILDKNSGEELERFPVQNIQEPTAIFKNDRREIYNNLILFTVMDESNKKDAQADMHIFQSVRTPAQNIVDEIFAAKRGQTRVSSGGYKIPPPPTGPAPEPPGSRDPYDFGGFRESIEHRQYNQFNVSAYGHSQFHNGGGFIGGPQRTSMMARPSYLPYREREDEIGSNELLERDVTRGGEAAAYARVRKPEKKESTYDTDLDQTRGVEAAAYAREQKPEKKESTYDSDQDQQLLNHCFDDIEKFVARLQQAAEAYKELERRKKERGGKGKKNVSGDGMLGHRARPPPAQDFVDIFQKFKLSFNLLAKLKAHIHDPNAPELVHFLFTPLSLIYEASRDPIHGNMNLGEQATAPVLTQDAKQLLLNCLTSKEIELWQALGKNWTTSKDEWKGSVPPYVPRFYDGWQPAPALVDEPAPRSNIETAVVAHHDQIRNRAQEQDVRDYVQNSVMPFPPEEERWARHERVQDFDHFEPDPRAPSPPRNVLSNASVVGYQQYVEQHIDRNHRAHNTPRVPEPQPPAPVSQPMMQQRPLDDNTAYLEELRRTGASVYEVLHDRQGKNQKELTVNKGDYLQVVDNSRNWWKVRNYKGESGYCPYTILKEVTNTADNSRDLASSMIAAAEQTAPPSLPEKKASRRGGYMPDQFLAQFEESQEAVPRSGGHFGAPSHFEEVYSSPLSLKDETDRERHAFRPVEPAHYTNKGTMGIHKTQPQDDVHNELMSKMGLALAERGGAAGGGGGGGEENFHPTTMSTSTASPPSSMSGMQPFYINQQSNQSSVATWLEAKGFSTMCRQTLKGFNGRDLFSLHRHEMEQLIGHEEATRLEGQITLQKKMTGYKTQSAAELNAIFKKRRARTDHQGAPLGLPPDFSPMTPSSYDVPDSDSDGDDRQLADTGKTLRDLLIRQRRKIVSTSFFNQQ